MIFIIRFGEPETKALWDDLLRRKKEDRLNSDEATFIEKWVKATHFLSHNPRHPSLNTHEIEDLTKKFVFLLFHPNFETPGPLLREISLSD